MPTIVTNGKTANGNNAGRTTPPRRGGVKMKEYLYLCATNWEWFVISLILCLGLAFWYLKTTAPTYSKSAAMMIKTDRRKKAISSNAAIFQDLGINGDSDIETELALIKSPDLMRDVVRNLSLDMTYHVSRRFRDEELYGSTLPVHVQLPDIPEESSAAFNLKLNRNGDYTLSELRLDGRDLNRGEINGRIGVPVATPLGNVLVSPAKSYNGQEDFEMKVSRRPVRAVAKGLLGGLRASIDDDCYNIINISYTSTNPDKAKDIVTEVMAAYNARWMRDKRELADNSSKFIDERIRLLQTELGSVDNDISSFKSAHLVPDVGAAASMYMSQATQATMALKDLRNQEYMAKYIRNYLHAADNKNKLLPTNSGLSNMALSGQISQYNSKILERSSLVAQSSATNPLVQEIDADLSAMRQALIASIDNEMVALETQIQSQEGMSGHATSQIASNPQQAKYLLSVERQQKVKETLYLYLLQKREENQLNQALTSYNTRIIREADGSNAPIAPRSSNVIMIALALGLCVPAAILYVKELSVSVVRGRKDIKEMKTPFAGEIPFAGNTRKAFVKVGHHKESAVVAVRENSRNAINEAFRVVRTNIEFMNSGETGCRIIMMTSANPGSGKTFVTFNLAKSFALKNKRVLCIDLDMRKSALSKYVTGRGFGIADYLANRVSDIEKLIVPVDGCDNLSVIPVGTMPPNPTELLFSERLHALFADLRNHYDYVFVDCPPVEVVADSTIISRYADSTLFVLRAGLLPLELLPVVDDYYLNGTYPNMSIILNGTVSPTSRYARRYGNPYGYGYGYGSAYVYSNDKK